MASVKRYRVLLGAGLAAGLLVLAGCGQESSPSSTPPSTAARDAPTSTAVPVVLPTVAPTVPAPATVPAETPKPTLAAVATPVPPATPTAAPTPEPTYLPPPVLALEITGPADGARVSGNSVMVRGLTTPGALVGINDERVAVEPDGGFQVEVGLAPGVNSIQVVAIDTQGNRATQVLSVTSLVLPSQPFMLLVTEPQDQSVVYQGTVSLSGRTGPEAVASVNGVPVSVDEFGIFATTITLEPGPNSVDVVATNNDGRVLSAVVSVIFRP